MTLPSVTSSTTTNPVARLGAVCASRGPQDVATRLRDLEAWIADDLDALESELATLPRTGSIAHLSAGHQLDLRGKLLRPICVALAAELGRGFGTAAREMALAVELMHNATLLHDDVIDLAERRRGAPAARAVYGNAASVLGGDWLLVEALKRVHKSGDRELLGRALDTIDKMIAAEALQLENRGRVNLERADYYRIVDGKTAALFRWALFAGATAGDLPPHQRTLLERYGGDLGVAFQLADDLLDVAGDPALTGKAVFADLNEGRMTYPLLLALERDGSLKREVEQILGREECPPLPAPVCDRLQRRLVATGSVRDCRALARRYADAAIACLAPLPEGPIRDALATLAVVAADRQR